MGGRDISASSDDDFAGESNGSGTLRWERGLAADQMVKSEKCAQYMNLLYITAQYTRYVMPRIYPTVSRRCNARNQVPTKYTLRCAKTPKPTKRLARSINPKTIKKLFHIHLQSICQPSPKRTQQRNIIPNRRRRQRPRTGRDPRRP